MNNYKKYLNKYTYLFIGLVSLIITSIFVIIPNFQTEEFNQDVIDDIIKGVTTTSTLKINEENQKEEFKELKDEDNLEISEEETNELTQNFTAFTAYKEVVGFDTYLLIGSDERNEETIATRGQVFGKRADVIIRYGKSKY